MRFSVRSFGCALFNYGGIFMYCDNNMCINNDEKNHCVLDEISISSIGLCNECILVSIELEEREKIRRKMLEFYDEVDKD